MRWSSSSAVLFAPVQAFSPAARAWVAASSPACSAVSRSRSAIFVKSALRRFTSSVSASMSFSIFSFTAAVLGVNLDDAIARLTKKTEADQGFPWTLGYYSFGSGVQLLAEQFEFEPALLRGLQFGLHPGQVFRQPC